MKIITILVIIIAISCCYTVFIDNAMAADDSRFDHLKKEDLSKIDWKKKDNNYWKDNLGELQYQVTRQDGTEQAFTGKYNKDQRPGVFRCSNCGLELFNSETKFDSRTGWPSFYQPISKEAVTEISDTKYGMIRTEVECSRCAAHLGHVFSDGPKPTGLRYCINSVSLVHSEDLKSK